MTTPPRGVLAIAETASLRPVQYTLDPAAQPARRFRLRGPDWLKRLHHERGVDRLHRTRAEDRLRIGRERAFPLGGVLGVPPAGAVRGDTGFRGILERQSPGGVECGFRASSPFGLDWVNALVAQSSALASPRSRLQQAHHGERTQAHLARLAAEHEAVNPRLCPRPGDLQIEAAAIRIHARPARTSDLQSRKLSNRPRHDTPESTHE